MSSESVAIVGGGLAGAEAAWQLAARGVRVVLYEMRPRRSTEAHVTDRLAELVCSNSFGSDNPHGASWMLKAEIAAMGAFVLSVARRHAVPAGASLAVDREKFSAEITGALEAEPNIRVVREEVTNIPDASAVILATGPLTSPALVARISELVGETSLYFYDAISPIVSFDSLDLDQLYFASRYDKGSPDFLNVPLTEAQYNELVNDLLTGEVVLPHDFEEERYFESCMPVEAIAARGPKTLAFGPLRPVGLRDPRTGKRPHAVVQLRKENEHGTAYNLVGFQTKLKYGEQVRILRKLPGFANAEFLRLGSLHRNTFLDSPRVLLPTLSLRKHPRVFIAGQLTGTEGYLESSATGLLAALNVYADLGNHEGCILPRETMLGGLVYEITRPDRKNFQPMNSNIGVLPPLPSRVRDKTERNRLYWERSKEALLGFIGNRPELFEDVSGCDRPRDRARSEDPACSDRSYPSSPA